MALLKFLLLFMQPLQSTSIHLQMDDMKASMQYSHPEEINNIWELEDNFQNDLKICAELTPKIESYIQRHQD